MEVGIPRIFNPARTCSPKKRTACAAVEPVPNPSVMPSRTKRRLARAAAAFSRSLVFESFAISSRDPHDRLLYRFLDWSTNLDHQKHLTADALVRLVRWDSRRRARRPGSRPSGRGRPDLRGLRLFISDNLPPTCALPPSSGRDVPPKT